MRLVYTEPLKLVIARTQKEAQEVYNLSHAHTMLVKHAGDAATTHALSGELYASGSGWLLLDVPNALVRGAFDALNEHGAELPKNSKGSLNAHISVMRPEEIATFGGIDKITERGKHFHYTLGPVQEAKPTGWDEMSKVWFIQVKSTELQTLRKSYGLSPLPNEGKFDFHITIAVRRKKVLQNNDVSKAAEEKAAFLPGLGLARNLLLDQVVANNMRDAPPEEVDPAEVLEQDDSALDQVRTLPTELPIGPAPRKDRRVITSVLKEGADNGMRRMSQQEEAGHPEKEAGGDVGGEEAVRVQPADEEPVQEGEDFDCDPDALDAIYSHYGPSGDDPADAVKVGSITSYVRDKAKNVWSGSKDKVVGLYRKLENRYGPNMAKAILISGAVGAPIPGPGTGVLTAAPMLALGEAIHAYRGNYNDPPEEQERRKKEMREKLKQLIVPAGTTGGAGLAALALHKPTDTLVPAQTTKFPNDPKPHLIRGGIYPGAKASVLEDTGGGYMFVGPEKTDDNTWTRLHAHVNDKDDFRKALQNQQRPGAPLEKLEIEGHGGYSGQNLGVSDDPDENLGPRTVGHVADTLNSIDKAPDATVYGYGCNTGLCRPQFSWWQRLADQTGMNALGARGYVTAERGRGTWQDVHSTGRTRPEDPQYYPRTTPHHTRAGDQINDAGEDYAFTLHRPHQPQEVVKTQDRGTRSKQTWGALPADRLHELLYNIGKPSAVAGAVATPFLSDRKTAKRTALLTTALAAPMALSELAARFGEAKANIATGGAPDSLNTHLGYQAKSLPYLGLAALPLLSYGGAKMLGRWKDKKDGDSTAHTVGALGGGGAGMLAGSALGPWGAAGGGALGALLGDFAGKKYHDRKKQL
jgi:hypothetical protein